MSNSAARIPPARVRPQERVKSLSNRMADMACQPSPRRRLRLPESKTMTILEMEEDYRRLPDEFLEARGRIWRIASNPESLPSDVRWARDRADELKALVRRVRIDLARALFDDGLSLVLIAGRLGTTLAMAEDTLAIGGDAVRATSSD